MKKSRIIAFVLAMTMIISCFASLGSVSAEEAAAPASASTPVIMSYNVAFGSYFYFEAAINTASVGGEGKVVNVNLYDSVDATTPVATAEATYTTENLPAYFGGSAYTVTIPYAISFADTAKEFYIEAECDGAKSAKAKYSIVEYCLQRLYKDAVTGDQKELCQNILNFAASIDKLDAEKTATALDYRYVAVKADGNVGGNRAAIVVNGNTAKVTVNAGASVSAWTVTTYAVDGTSTVTEMSAEEAAAGFEVTGNMIFVPKAAPIVAAPGTYFEALGGYTFDNDESVLSLNNNRYVFGASNAVNDTTYASGSSYVVYDAASYNTTAGQRHIYMNLVENPKDAADKVLRFHKYGLKDNTQAYITNKNNENKTGNVFVFETDFYLSAVPAEVSSLVGSSDPSVLKFFLASSQADSSREGNAQTSWNASAITTWVAFVSAFANEDSTYSYYLTAKQNDKGVVGIELLPETWYTITIEVHEDVKGSSYVYCYVDGTYVFGRSLGVSYDIDSYDSMGIYTRPAVAKDGFGAYLDDTFVGVIEK